MANKKLVELDHIIQIDDTLYSITAEKVVNKLTINVKNGETETYTFDGSKPIDIDIDVSNETSHEADVAKKVENALTVNVIKDGETTPIKFDGSAPVTIDVGEAGSAKNAEKILVNVKDNTKVFASITVSEEEPKEGSVGDIWFKY